MIKSMTGYGRAVETVNGREFTVELRSVNNRYLDCSVRLPRILSFGEEAVKQAVKNAVSRGKVDVFISVRSESGDEVQVTLNKAVLESYLTAMHQMVEEYGVADDISVSAVSRLPEVFSLEKPQVDEEQLLADLMAVTAKALESYDAMRTTEGAIVYGIVLMIEKDGVTVDFNHPLAGENLHYKGEVKVVRDATEEELNPKHGCCGCGSHGCGDGGCSDSCCDGCNGGCN